MAITEHIQSIEELTQSVSSLTDMENKLIGILAAVKSQLKQGDATLEDYNKVVGAGVAALRDRKKASDDVRKALRDESKNYRSTAEAAEQANKKIAAMSMAIKKVSGALGRYVGAMGGTIVSLSNATEAVTKYKIELAELSRVNTVLGRSMDGLQNSFSFIAKETDLSKNEFLELNNTVLKTFKGIPPSTQAIAEMAKAFRDQLGPGVEKVKEGMDIFLKMQEKFPPMAKSYQGLIDMVNERNKAKEAGEDTSAMDAEIKKQKELLMLMADSKGFDVGEIDTIAKMGSDVSDATKEAEDFTSGQKKLAQATADLANTMGNQLAPIITFINKALTSVIVPTMKFIGWIAYAAANLGTVVSVILKVVNAFKKAKNVIQSLSKGKGLSSFVSSTKAGAEGAGKMGGALGRMSGQVGRFSGMLRGAGAVAGKFVAVIQLLMLAMDTAKYFKKGRELGMGIPEAIGKGLLMGLVKVGAPIKAMFASVFSIFNKDKTMKEAFNESYDETVKLSEQLLGLNAPIEEANKNLELEALSLREIIQNVNESERTYKEVARINNEILELLKKQVNISKELGGLAFSTDLVGQTKDMIANIENVTKEARKFAAAMVIENPEMLKALDVNMEGVNQEELDKYLSGGANKLSSAIDKAKKDISNEKTKLAKELIDLQKAAVDISPDDTDSLKKNKDAQDKNAREMADAQSRESQLIEQSIRLESARTDVMSEGLRIMEARKLAMEGEADAALSINKSVEGRLNAEAKLLSQAQFGLGASVAMMQQQVNLAYENLEVRKKQQKTIDADVDTQIESNSVIAAATKDMTEGQKKELRGRILNAKSQEHLKQVLLESGIAQEDLETAANAVVEPFKLQQAVSKDIAEEQSKIYELTKSVREGYLDAIREMSTGAGEFEKIIGKQDMGVTQLMETVKEATGEYQTNSMRLGTISNSGVGTTPAYTFTQNGISGPGMTKAHEDRLWKPKLTEAEKRKVGSAVVMNDQNLGAIRDSNPNAGEIRKNDKAPDQAALEAQFQTTLTPGVQAGNDGVTFKEGNAIREAAGAELEGALINNNPAGETTTPAAMPPTGSKEDISAKVEAAGKSNMIVGKGRSRAVRREASSSAVASTQSPPAKQEPTTQIASNNSPSEISVGVIVDLTPDAKEMISAVLKPGRSVV